MNKKFWAIALVTLSLIGSVAGCTGGEEEYGYDDDNYWSSGATDSYGNESDGYGYVCTGGVCADYGY